MEHAHSFHHQHRARRDGHPNQQHGTAKAAATRAPGLNHTAFQATLHCLSGCAIGEILGMVIGTAFAWSNGATVAISVALAFLFGYAFTMVPLLKAGIAPRAAASLALASDTASIALMEVVDNAAMLVWPGAMDATLASATFWLALAASLLLAGLAAFPLNRALIARGRGHAVVHAHHGHAH
jgi:hypothetical protein